VRKKQIITQGHIEEAARNGISKEKLRRRVRDQDWHVERAATQPPSHKFSPEEKEIMKEHGVTFPMLYKRIEKGMTREEAMRSPRIDRSQKTFTKSELAILKENNIRVNTAIQRVRTSGWSKEKAMTYPVQPRNFWKD
jgi:hypothetical protein